MALQKEIWVNKIQEELYENANFLVQSVDHKQYIAYKTVHVPQSGAAAAIATNPTSFPLGVTKRVDTDRTYAMNQYTFNEVQLVSNIDELQFSYNLKDSVVGQQISAMTEHIGNKVAIDWTASGAANMVLTTGSAVATSLPPSGTGTRNAVALADIIALAKKLDKDNVPSKGRVLLMNSDMFWELHSISDVVRASYNGFASNVLQTGVVSQLFGFDIMVRPTVSVFTKTGTAAKAIGTAAAADDRQSCIAFHKTAVSRALGSIEPLFNAGSNGNGLPEYLGSTFNIEVMLGAAILRDDMKGVAALVQTWVS